MIRFRPFRNTDPPVVTTLWRSCFGRPGLVPEVSADLFEQFVFAKLYFDYDGLITAWDGDRPVGFAHAGFGPNETEDDVCTHLGVTCLVLVRPDCSDGEVAPGLLARSEEYLRSHGAKVLYGGGIKPLNPFYLGLYGGSELPGVLRSDALARELFASHGYREIDRTLVMRLPLGNFQAVIDRRQMQIRRQVIVEVNADPPSRSWWEACTLGEFELTRFEVLPRGGGATIARATFRAMEIAAADGISRAAGLVELFVEESMRRRGLAVFLLSEAARQFARQGIAFVEAQLTEHNAAALGVYRKLGFRQADEGSVFRKE